MSAEGARWLPGPAWLFCPGDRPDRYLKAIAMADMVILDLEDAVAPHRRAAARDALRQLASQGRLVADRTVVRINAVGTDDHELDLAATGSAGVRRVMVSKCEDPSAVAAIGHDVVALAETARGVERAGEIAQQRNVVGFMWGADDMVAGMGGFSSRWESGVHRDVARYARARVLMAAKAHDLLALDTVHMDIPDTQGLARACEDAVAVGFDGTVAIHPSQVGIIRDSYRPAAERADWARRLLDHVGGGRGVTTFEGRMVDGPVYAQAERILQLASPASAT